MLILIYYSGAFMSLHSYTRCWIHLIWGTHNREKVLTSEACEQLKEYLISYSKEKNIFIKQIFVNPDHVHILFDIPTNMTIEDIAHLLKGNSSHWINRSNLLKTKFAWGRGYGAFSVSHSALQKVSDYIKNQKEHHKKRSFTEEYEEFIKLYELNLNR